MRITEVEPIIGHSTGQLIPELCDDGYKTPCARFGYKTPCARFGCSSGQHRVDAIDHVLHGERSQQDAK